MATDPSEPIHSGTGNGPTPGDDRGPESPDSAVRNPALAARHSEFRPDGRAATTQSSPAGDGPSPSGQGYWLHDAAGPQAYIPPTAPKTVSGDEDLAQIVDALALNLGSLPDGSQQMIQVVRQGGRVVLTGFVTSDVMRRAALRCAASLVHEPVEDELVVR